ncbi:hypothetical protein IAQ61_007631 [Plenodomus lingam]|nr:hypothetical protein IAQ61_007631 [Plenodomus lingam]
MTAGTDSTPRIKCTYQSCGLYFVNEKAMKRHKRYSEEHEYCHLCNEDFDTIEDYIQHKIIKPVEHKKACRVCGDEFKSDSGLKRHIELNHKLDQSLTCIGCQQTYYRACLFIEHLEYGHCAVITANQFQGHIVHKHLISEFLKDGTAYARFKQKTSKYDAAVDYEEEGGVELEGNPLEVDDAIGEVKFAALKPDTPPETPLSQAFAVPYPPLPSQVNKGWYEIASSIGDMSITDDSEVSIIRPSAAATFPSLNGASSRAGSSVQGSSVAFTSRRPKAWGSRAGKTATNILFPHAKPTPAPSDFSILAHDEAMEDQKGINIMRTRFWDPMSSDWNPEKFYDSVLNKFACPFVCEQTFESVSDLNQHILGDHRITRIKCPTCLKYFKSATALIAHCESRGAKCPINKADDYNIFLDRISGGFLAVDEQVRPDHLNNQTVFITDPVSGHMEKYRAPVASYLRYMVTTPPDWKEPVKAAAQIGGMFRGTSRW